MPRNLTDLMEAAVSTAPPEPHQAARVVRVLRQDLLEAVDRSVELALAQQAKRRAG